jgi:ribosome-associated toxin RatA of RatAB toxin-antitoxin module
MIRNKSLQRHLPYPVQSVYDLIMDVSSYPVIFPMVTKAELLPPRGNSPDKHVKLTFNLPPLIRLANPTHIARITGRPHHRIEAAKVQSPLKHLEMAWDLKPSATGGTNMTFRMDYDSGLGFLADAFLNANMDSLLAQAMTRFESHAAKMLKSTVTPAAANQNQSPASGQVPQKKTGPQP